MVVTGDAHEMTGLTGLQCRSEMMEAASVFLRPGSNRTTILLERRNKAHG